MKKDKIKLNSLVLVSCVLGWALIFFWGVYFYLKCHYSNEISLSVFGETLDKATLGFILIIAISWFLFYIDKFPAEKFDKFLALPDKNSNFTFPVLSTFLGEQAFASLVATILISFSKDIYLEFDILMLSMYATMIIIPMLTFSAMSVLRFIFYFTKYQILVFLVLSLLSWAFMFVMIYVGMKLGGG